MKRKREKLTVLNEVSLYLFVTDTDVNIRFAHAYYNGLEITFKSRERGIKGQ